MSVAKVYDRPITDNNCLTFKTVTNKLASCWHTHQEFEIVYIESGYGQLQYGNIQKSYEHGDIFILGPWVPHQFIEISKNHISISLLFNQDLITPGFLNSDLAKEIKLLLDKTRYGMVFKTSTSNIEIDNIKSIFSAVGLEKAMYLLFLLRNLSRHQTCNLLSQPEQTVLPQKKYSKIQDILAYINKNAYRKLPLDEVARTFYMSSSHFSRFFHEQTGTPFSQYLLSTRVERACHLLTNTDLPITQIGQDVGFDSLSSFNRCFSKMKNSTPRDFRNSQ